MTRALVRGGETIAVLALLAVACSGGTSSSSGPTQFAGTYLGTISVAGLVKSLTVTITEDGFVLIDVPGGIVCPGDIPDRIGLDGDSFDATESAECVLAGTLCPFNIIITGAVSNRTVTGSGQVLLGCPNRGGTFGFNFEALRD